MKKTKIIKKTDVIKALKKEKLTHHGWFQTQSDYMDGFPLNCNVCAVGAVLRYVSFEKWARTNDLNLNWLGWVAVKNTREIGGQRVWFTEKHLKDRNYLAALSNYFESGKTKQQCMRFVNKNFPKQFELTINLTN